MKFTCVVFQVQDDGAYPLGIDDPPNAIGFCIVPLFWVFLLCVEIKIGVDVVSASLVPEHVPRRGVKISWNLLVVHSRKLSGEDETY